MCSRNGYFFPSCLLLLSSFLPPSAFPHIAQPRHSLIVCGGGGGGKSFFLLLFLVVYQDILRSKKQQRGKMDALNIRNGSLLLLLLVVVPNHQRWHAKWKLSWNMHTLHTRFLHVWRRFAMLSRCLVTKFRHRSSVGSLLRVRCWLGRCCCLDPLCI